jgi:two-component system CheB/CheR fusion protein
VSDSDKSQDSRQSGRRQKAAAQGSTPSPIVVGIGASVASLPGIERLFAHASADRGRATVIVLQHHEALDEERLMRAVRSSGEQVVPVENGADIQGGHVYIAPPNAIVTVKNSRFRLRPTQQSNGERGAIDSFLISLAEDQGEQSVGVVLHGTAGSGTLGVAAFKEHGGLTIAERGPEESAHDLAVSNSPGALADFLLTPEEIPERIRLYGRHLARLREQKGNDAMLAEVSASLDRVAAILLSRTGHDFHGYKRNTFLRRVQRRMQVVQRDTVDEYVELMRSNPEEVQSLFNDLLIGVTQFFRDAKEFEVLETQVIPKLFEGKGPSDQVRVWVLGCATGEEAYGLAILMREHMATLDAPPNVQIFATDIDGRALAAARAGRYPEAIAADMKPERLARWFVKEGNTYCIVKELREMCIFSAHNVIRDAPFSRLSLVSCRNLLIYLEAELQNRVIPLFHFALQPDGYLFLGNSENVTRHSKFFAPIDRRSRIFRRMETGTRILPDFPITAPGRRPIEFPATARPRVSENSLARRAERVAERHAPAYVITDEQFEVLHFSGRTGRYIDPTAGTASLDLLSLAHRDLRLDLRSALHKAREQNEPVETERVQVGLDGHRLLVDLVVEPVQDKPNGPRNFVVLFKDVVLRPEEDESSASRSLVRDEHIQRLESELHISRERLQATIEELENTNEELKSSNEEYQSLNEELQAANEELETSKEELQSVNEELTTVNGELAHRVHELTRATSDLKNFLESTQIATLFLDNELRVMNFTPALTGIFHLVETDIGRPIAHIKSRMPFDDLQEDVRKVMRTLAGVERTIDDRATHHRYILRILPYRSTDNFIAGVVVTFVDVTPLTRAQERQRVLLGELQHRVRNTLSVVRSIARRTAETSESVEDYAMHLDGRLSAFARTQSLVTRDPGAGIDLEYLVAEELLAYHAHDGEQANISGPRLRLQPRAAETLGLAVHELATNAVKHGALSQPSGRVDVSWHIMDGGEPPHLRLDWVERGGPTVSEPQRRGFGTELLERVLAFELKARTSLAYEPEGLRCAIELPLDARVRFTGGD